MMHSCVKSRVITDPPYNRSTYSLFESVCDIHYLCPFMAISRQKEAEVGTMAFFLNDFKGN